RDGRGDGRPHAHPRRHARRERLTGGDPRTPGSAHPDSAAARRARGGGARECRRAHGARGGAGQAREGRGRRRARVEAGAVTPATRPTELSVNVDHVATLRQARGGDEPDPARAAVLALDAGAAGITVHLREDRRHIQDRDLEAIRALRRGDLNLEMALTGEMIEIAVATRPERVTLVPEKRAELTTEGGLDLHRDP